MLVQADSGEWLRLKTKNPHKMRFGWAVGYDGRTLGAEELSRDVEGLAADDNNLLAVEELLGDNGGETAKEMALAVNDNLEDVC